MSTCFAFPFAFSASTFFFFFFWPCGQKRLNYLTRMRRSSNNRETPKGVPSSKNNRQLVTCRPFRDSCMRTKPNSYRYGSYRLGRVYRQGSKTLFHAYGPRQVSHNRQTQHSTDSIARPLSASHWSGASRDTVFTNMPTTQVCRLLLLTTGLRRCRITGRLLHLHLLGRWTVEDASVLAVSRTTSVSNSKHWFTTSFLQPLPYLVTP